MSKKIIPPWRPRLEEKSVREYLMRYNLSIGDTLRCLPLALLGIRGYYAKSMGETPRNERGIYDDALFVVSVNAYAAFNANTDPTLTRPKMASLVEGCYFYSLGIHRGRKAQYPAVVQNGQVTVKRDGGKIETDNPTQGQRFGINIHKGGYTNTSSEGCQTIHPAQWDAFLSLVTAEATRYGLKFFPYVLVEQ